MSINVGNKKDSAATQRDQSANNNTKGYLIAVDNKHNIMLYKADVQIAWFSAQLSGKTAMTFIRLIMLFENMGTKL